ncbi:LysR family transcriptional regulator [Acetobacter oeni]|uniref:LysR family transcriptional regulator n=1 Tax=Acetobacter oeni TaxID=304077 RepID=A0A511XQ79_9PROT|nr:LysR family transcriptional regulator [Acetobacter oeni]MBB3884770.1 DNA-binding transcriptional LysR family regulator [Acetobacter oeni]NHO20706.1 LysR family transcriptional regulator [Acetobacter oeni]GBR06841.1 LysR family transcriptional regulator [Acetobacter oeni LMG 21952]GEN65123.1 LysR family transcriptional regulator [Acetobacter oeni]
MDRLDVMRLFMRIVECGSFTRAAADMDLPRSTATDVIRALEIRLGVRLLHRTTRQVSATPEGETYYHRCRDIVADIEDAEASLGTIRPRGVVRIDVHGTLARHFLLPALPALLATYPDIELHMSEGDRLVDPVREGMDCLLRVGELRDSDMTVRSLGFLDEVTLASPAYLEKHGTPAHPDGLPGGHVMVGFQSSLRGRILPLEFMIDGKVREVALPSRMAVNAAESYIAAARAGMGLIQIPRYHAEHDLRNGALVEILKTCPPSPSPVSLLSPHNRQMSPRVRVFIDWVVERFRSSADRPNRTLQS